MSLDLSTYKVASSETSSDTKFDNLVQAIQDSLNAVGDTTKMAWAAGLIFDPAQLRQNGATPGQVLAWDGAKFAPGASAVAPSGISQGGATTSQALVWSGSAWAAALLPLAGIAQGGATAGQVLTWSGSVWAPAAVSTAGAELDYVQITTDVTVSATTEGTANTVITGTSTAYDATKKNIEFFCPGLTESGSTTNTSFVILRGATVVGQATFGGAGSAQRDGCVIKCQDTPSASTFSYVVKAFNSAANNSTVKAGAGGAGTLLPAHLRVTKA